jgi:hydroxymethylglutaryl-CoA lyase
VFSWDEEGHPVKVTIYEVGPRDGLQSLKHVVPVEKRRELIQSLYNAGIKDIEEVSFVHPKILPQMADAEEVFSGRGAALVLNRRGFDRAITAGAEKINVVISPCETFNLKNMGKRHGELLLTYRQFLNGYPKDKVRVYISMAFGSPDSGIFSEKHLDIMVRDAKMLGDTVVFADTVGCATHRDISMVADLAFKHGMTPALHLHHRGDESRPISLIRAGLLAGIRQFDSSIAGLGGCAEGSGANLATETLNNHLKVWGFETDIDERGLRAATSIAREIKFLAPEIFYELPA